MKGRGVVPLTQLGTRPPEAGRIRMGVKSGKAMKSIDFLRFTSPDEDLIRRLADLYGGTAEPWFDERASPKNQWQVTSTTKKIPVWVVKGGLSTWYEQWSGGGNSRRCDGVTAEVPAAVGDDYELRETPCICDMRGEMECKPYTRLQVIIPALPMAGVWRLETKGWNAAQELPGMFAMIDNLQGQSVLPAALSIQRRQENHAGRKRDFVVPRLELLMTPEQIASGGTALAISAHGPSTPALPPGVRVPTGFELNAAPEVVQAEVLDDELLAIEALLEEDAENFGLDKHRYVDAVTEQCSVRNGQQVSEEEKRQRMRDCSKMVRAELLTPRGFVNGRVDWKKNGG